MDSTPGSRPRQPPLRQPDADLGAELRATLNARQDLGVEYEPALVEGFIERLDRAVDARVDARMRSTPPVRQNRGDGGRLALAIISVTLGIPLTGITLIAAHSLLAMIIVWAAIVVVNMAYAVRR